MKQLEALDEYLKLSFSQNYKKEIEEYGITGWDEHKSIFKLIASEYNGKTTYKK